MHYNIVVFGVKDTTRIIVEHIISLNFRVDLLVTIDENVTKKNHVSGFSTLDDVANNNGTDLLKVSSYSLNDADSRDFFENNTFELGISMGWQRLIPQYVLERFRYGIFGLHGSCGYLPFGRGRSPLNWTIIHGDDRVILNLFRYDKEADSPNIFANIMFEVTPFDTIRTLQYKNIIAAKDMISRLLAGYNAKSINISTDSHDFSSWYAKRTPEAGKIDFHARTREIYNLIRAVTKPFPGAFAFCDNKKITIWQAIPFDKILDFSSYIPGQVIGIFDNNFVIRTVDGSLLIQDYEYDCNIEEGSVLT